MAGQTIVGSKPQTQTLSVGKHSQAIASKHEDLINPSRKITPDDVLYLRDYTIAAAVISADKGVFGTHLQFQASDITNIGMSDDGATV